MRKILIGLLFFTSLSSIAHAQYTKAGAAASGGGGGSVKEGMFYSYGGNVKLQNEGRKGGYGVVITIGRYKPGRAYFFAHDLELITPIRYNYIDNVKDWSTTASTPVNVTGRTDFGASYRFHFGMVFNNGASSTNPFKPFFDIFGGFSAIQMKDEARDPYIISSSRTTLDYGGYTYGGAAGASYNFSQINGIRLMVGYTKLAKQPYDAEDYSVLTNHPFIQLSFNRFFVGD